VRTYSAGFGPVLAIFGGFLALSTVINFAAAQTRRQRQLRPAADESVGVR